MPSPLVYIKELREVRTVVDYFAQDPRAAVKFSWEDGLRAGAPIAAGNKLGVLYWDDGNTTDFFAPAGCTGSIVRTNRRIQYEMLHISPSQLMLQIS